MNLELVTIHTYKYRIQKHFKIWICHLMTVLRITYLKTGEKYIELFSL